MAENNETEIIIDPHTFFDENLKAQKLPEFYRQPETDSDGKVSIEELANTFYDNKTKLEALSESRNVIEQSQLILGEGNLSLVTAPNPEQRAKNITQSLENQMYNIISAQAGILTKHAMGIDPESVKRTILTAPSFTVPEEWINAEQDKEKAENSRAYNNAAQAVNRNKELVEQSEKLGNTGFSTLYLSELAKDGRLGYMNHLMGGSTTDLDAIARTLKDESAERTAEKVHEIGEGFYFQNDLTVGRILRDQYNTAKKEIETNYKTKIAGTYGSEKAALYAEKATKLKVLDDKFQGADKDARRLGNSFARTINRASEKATQEAVYPDSIRQATQTQ